MFHLRVRYAETADVIEACVGRVRPLEPAPEERRDGYIVLEQEGDLLRPTPGSPGVHPLALDSDGRRLDVNEQSTVREVEAAGDSEGLGVDGGIGGGVVAYAAATVSAVDPDVKADSVAGGVVGLFDRSQTDIEGRWSVEGKDDDP